MSATVAARQTSPETFNAALPQALARIQAARSIAVFSHYSPDPDAYGSSCGLALALELAGKAVEIVNQDGIIEKLRFIPGVPRVVETPKGKSDLLIVCDCGDLGRVGDALKSHVTSAAEVINIDHHTSNDGFGTIQLVDETASSSSELVLRLLSAGNFKISPEVATALFFGISADTGSFKYSSTAASTFDAAALLVRAGARPLHISELLYSSQSMASVRLQAETLSQMRLLADGRLCVLTVTPDMVQRLSASGEDSEGLVEKGRDIAGVRVSVLIRWVDDLWRISLRSRDARWNVSTVAQEFGGGGHKVAAAFRWKKSLSELEALLLPRLTELVKA